MSEANEIRMAQEYEAFYGGRKAPLSALTAALYSDPSGSPDQGEDGDGD